MTKRTVHLFFIKLDMLRVFVGMFCFPDMRISNPWVVCKHAFNKQTVISSCNGSRLHFSAAKLFKRQPKHCCIIINNSLCFSPRGGNLWVRRSVKEKKNTKKKRKTFIVQNRLTCFFFSHFQSLSMILFCFYSYQTLVSLNFSHWTLCK